MLIILNGGPEAAYRLTLVLIIRHIILDIRGALPPLTPSPVYLALPHNRIMRSIILFLGL